MGEEVQRRHLYAYHVLDAMLVLHTLANGNLTSLGNWHYLSHFEVGRVGVKKLRNVPNITHTEVKPDIQEILPGSRAHKVLIIQYASNMSESKASKFRPALFTTSSVTCLP